MKWNVILLSLALLAGCESTGLAPILDSTTETRKPESAQTRSTAAERQTSALPEVRQQDGYHQVQKGDTLFAIAFQNSLDYRDLAFWNNLPTPDVIKVGQMLRLTPPEDNVGRSRGVETLPLQDAGLLASKPLKDVPVLAEPKAQRLPYSESNWALLSGQIKAPESESGVSSSARQVLPLATDVRSESLSSALAYAQKQSEENEPDDWRWPAEGRLLGTFGVNGGKGIDIAGTHQSSIVATAPGKVVYSGSGLRGYGKMLIIKHPDEYLSAYAHNHQLLVKEGDWVKGGQKIAEMGDSDAERVKLHFEIRQFGKPLDPLKLLPERK